METQDELIHVTEAMVKRGLMELAEQSMFDLPALVAEVYRAMEYARRDQAANSLASLNLPAR